MSTTLKILRMLQWAMLASVLLYVLTGELIARHPVRIDQTLSYFFSSLAVGVVGTIFVVRRTLVLPAALSLAVRPEDAMSLNHWRTGYLVTYALCDALAVFGLVLRIRGSSLQQSALFYISGFILLLFFRPRSPATAAT